MVVSTATAPALRAAPGRERRPGSAIPAPAQPPDAGLRRSTGCRPPAGTPRPTPAPRPSAAAATVRRSPPKSTPQIEETAVDNAAQPPPPERSPQPAPAGKGR